MKKVSESSFWKKVTAVICMVALLIGSFYFVPERKVEAKESSVESITLKGMDGITWCDDEEVPFLEWCEEDGDISFSETYRVKLEGEDIMITSADAQQLDTKVVLYIQAEGFPKVSADQGAVAKVSSGTSTGTYKVLINLSKVQGSKVTLTPTPQYSVTFPFAGDGYNITEYGSDISYAGQTVQVAAEGSLRFSVKLDENLSSSKSIQVTANGKTLSKDEDSTPSCYHYTLTGLKQNTTIAVSAVNKTFTVSLPVVEGYTVASAGGGNTIEVGGTYNFYVTPKDGYIRPSVATDLGKVKLVDGNLYQLSLNKEDVASFSQDAITITLKETGKETVNVIYRSGTGYVIQDENGGPLTAGTVTYGESLKFKVAAEEGYEITGVFVNDLPLEEKDGCYVTDPITATSTVTVTAARKTYHITLPVAGDGFAFQGIGSSTVTHGESYSFMVIGASGYEAPTVYAYPGDEKNEELRTEENQLPGTNNSYALGNVTSDMYIDVQAGSKIQYVVDFPSGEGYEFTETSLDGNNKAAYGVEVSFKVEPQEGYNITSVRENNNILTKSESGSYTFTVQEDTVISVTAEKKIYKISYPEESNTYTFTPLGDSTVEYGESYSFYVTADERYNQPTVSYEMGNESHTITPVSGDNLYVISQISGDVTITITPGDWKTHTVYLTPTDGVIFQDAEGKEISSTAVSVADGNPYSFQLSLTPEYSESKPYVAINNIRVEPNEAGIYTIPDVKADQVVSVTNVNKNIYTVTLKQGTGYRLTTTENTKVEAGSSFTFAVSAEIGYDLADASVYYKTADGTPILVETAESGYYTISEVPGNMEVYVEGVSQIVFQAEVTAEHSLVAATEGSSLENIEYNGSISFTVTPEEYYELTQVAVNGEVKEAVNGVYTVNNITSDVTIQVITTPKTVLTVEYKDAKFGNSETDTFTIEDIREGRAVIKTPEYSSTSYTFDSWYEEEETPWKSGETFTEDDVNSHIVLTAKWVLTKNVLKDLVTEGSITTSDNSQFVVTISTLLNFAEDLEESDKTNIRIVGYGTLYAPEKFILNEEIKEKVQGRNHTEEGFYTDEITNRLLNYYYNCSTPASEFNSEGFAIAATSGNKPNERWGAGWIAIQLNGNAEETIYVYAEPVKASDQTVDMEEALANVIDAVPCDQTSAQESKVSEQNDEETQTALPTEKSQTEANEAEPVQADSAETEAQVDSGSDGQIVETAVE